MPIRVNNHYNNRNAQHEPLKEKDIEIKQDCIITNYDTRDENYVPNGSSDMTISVQDGNIEYKRGQSSANANDVEMNVNKYSIFTIIASADSSDENGKELTLSDIENIKKLCNSDGTLKNDKEVNDTYLKSILKKLKALGLSLKFRFDIHNGVTTIKIGDKELLRIDFVMEHEKPAKATKPSQADSSRNTTNTTITPKADETTIKNELCKLAGKKKPEDLTLSDLQKIREKSGTELNKMGLRIAIDSDAGIVNVYGQESKPIVHFEFTVKKQETLKEIKNMTPMEKLYSAVPKKYEELIKNAATKAEVSEDFIRHLIFTEGDSKTKEAKLTAYYDKNGILTIGFGHTNLTDNAKNGNGFKKGETISLERAFEFLVADIKEHKKYAKDYIGVKFEKLEPSVQEGLIDRSFQAGQGGFLGETIKANIRDNHTTAIVARNLWVPSDIRRSAMRFLMVVNGMTKEEQISAKKRFENLGHYKEVVDYFYGKEKQNFINAYNALG